MNFIQDTFTSDIKKYCQGTLHRRNTEAGVRRDVEPPQAACQTFFNTGVDAKSQRAFPPLAHIHFGYDGE